MGYYGGNTGGGSGQAVLAVSTQSASFTASANTLYQVSASSAAVTVTLPTSSTSQAIVVKKTDASANAVVLSGTINGSVTTISLLNQNQSKELYANGSGGWITLRGDLDPATLASSSSANGFLTATGLAKITVGTTAPSSPAVGDLWIDTN